MVLKSCLFKKIADLLKNRFIYFTTDFAVEAGLGTPVGMEIPLEFNDTGD